MFTTVTAAFSYQTSSLVASLELTTELSHQVSLSVFSDLAVELNHQTDSSVSSAELSHQASLSVSSDLADELSHQTSSSVSSAELSHQASLSVSSDLVDELNYQTSSSVSSDITAELSHQANLSVSSNGTTLADDEALPLDTEIDQSTSEHCQGGTTTELDLVVNSGDLHQVVQLKANRRLTGYEKFYLLNHHFVPCSTYHFPLHTFGK